MYRYNKITDSNFKTCPSKWVWLTSVCETVSQAVSLILLICRPGHPETLHSSFTVHNIYKIEVSWKHLNWCWEQHHFWQGETDLWACWTDMSGGAMSDVHFKCSTICWKLRAWSERSASKRARRDAGSANSGLRMRTLKPSIAWRVLRVLQSTTAASNCRRRAFSSWTSAIWSFAAKVAYALRAHHAFVLAN